MMWTLLTITSAFLWSIGNHIDKFLIERYFKTRSTTTLLMFSSLIGLCIAPIFFFIKPEVLDISFINIFVLILSGVLGAIVFWLYFKALEHEEVSIVVPFFQLIPVFGYIFGYFILGEVLTLIQIIAMLLIIFGATILSIEIDEENKFKLRKKTIFYMVLSALLSALDSVIFKYILLKEDFIVSTFWSYVGLGMFGLGLFIFVKKYRRDFIYALDVNSKKIISLNILNESLSNIANVIFTLAYVFAPIALVLLFNSYQPVFVFLIGIVITVFFPKLGIEKITLRHIIQKVLVLSIMGVGTYLLFW